MSAWLFDMGDRHPTCDSGRVAKPMLCEDTRMTIKEIALTLGLSHKAVELILTRAKWKLSKSLLLKEFTEVRKR